MHAPLVHFSSQTLTDTYRHLQTLIERQSDTHSYRFWGQLYWDAQLARTCTLPWRSCSCSVGQTVTQKDTHTNRKRDTDNHRKYRKSAQSVFRIIFDCLGFTKVVKGSSCKSNHLSRWRIFECILRDYETAAQWKGSLTGEDALLLLLLLLLHLVLLQ